MVGRFFTQRSKKIQLVGETFVTNTQRLKKALRFTLVTPSSSRSTRLVPDRVSRPVRRWLSAGRHRSRSHRSGETEDTTIADLVVATNAGRSRLVHLLVPSKLLSTNPASP